MKPLGEYQTAELYLLGSTMVLFLGTLEYDGELGCSQVPSIRIGLYHI